MKRLRLLTLITAATGLLAVSARADDRDKDHKKEQGKDKKHKKHPKQYYYDQRPSVTFGTSAPRRYYYGHSSSVIIERARPVYYEGRSDDVRPSYSYRSVEIDVQRGLARRGYYRGPLDADIGPGTRAGIRAFQDDSGLAATGRIDRDLIAALR